MDRFSGGQVAYVWADSDALPETREPGIGLILMRFDGTVDDGFREKILGEGVTAERVSGRRRDRVLDLGRGALLLLPGPSGDIIDDGRRWVDDALIWYRWHDDVPTRDALGRDAAIEVGRVAGLAEPARAAAA